MAEYLDNIFTDDDLASKEFIDAVSKDLADITGYEGLPQKKENDSVSSDPLDEVRKKESIEVVSIDYDLLPDMSNDDKVKKLMPPRNKANISIDENNNIFCSSWGNYFIEGSEFFEETVMMIDEYLEECEKPIVERDFSKFIIGKKTVTEKFKDTELNMKDFNIDEFMDVLNDNVKENEKVK